MNDRHCERLAAASGIVFLLFAGILLFVIHPDQPELGASAADVQRYQLEEPVHLYLTVFTVATLFLVGFVGAVVAMLGADGGPLSSVALVGGVLGLVGVYLTITLQAVAAFRPEDRSPELTRLIWDATYLPLPVFGVGLIAFLIATGLTILRTGVLPAWLGWLSFVPAALNGVSIGQISKNDGYFLGDPGFTSFVVWMLVTSVVLSLRVARRAPARARAAAAGSTSG